ncbi:hypothetical protein Leryth_000401 [Lithospermum erythrorhizon]|uniref:Uncharacterized protein n=1 Tax=Lithospermum erythrorhizon TaxID=34254 RepID=A0AAV3NPU6_LITER|nr:hypothetical protein Leryth_000401 [Lithospermum erythrorhizon]
MGSCVSVHKDPTSAIKLRFSVGSSKNEEILIPSPIKEKPLMNGDNLVVSDVVVKDKTQTSFRSYGSKEELFFDSQPWLESDCEDDFYSVNGDFTPSRGNTPVHHSFSSALQRKIIVPEKAPVPLPEPSPKKRLSELFEESLREHQDIDDQDLADNNNDKSLTGTPYGSGAISVCSAERTSNGARTPDDTSVRYAQCCMPRLLSVRSYSGRKKKLSPGHNVG